MHICDTEATSAKVFLLIIIVFLASSQAFSATPPYPQSTVITGVTWDTSSLKRAAPGSDLWPTTWADDDNIYTAWGDGGGFGGDNTIGRVQIGVARIAGTPESLLATNTFGGASPLAPATFGGKPGGIISVGGVLYMSVTENDTWNRAKIYKSTDHGVTWTSTTTGWDFEEPNGLWSSLMFVTYGKDNANARDNYVYALTHKDGTAPPRYNLLMARVPKDKVDQRNAYEFFTGFDAGGNPLWSPDINAGRPFFTDPNSVGFAPHIEYNPGLKRYILTTYHNESGGWGIFDAPEPWGPWTTVAYYENWLDANFKFGFSMPQKWLSPDGRDFVMVFSGAGGGWDSWNTIRGTFLLSAPSGPPQTVSNPRLNITR